MSEENDQEEFPQATDGKPMTRQEIIQAVTEPGFITASEKKNVIIPSTASQADFQETVKKLKINADSISYRILKLFCDQKKASNIDAETLMQRIENLPDEELKILELICAHNEFTTKAILDFILSLKKIGSHRILLLGAFTDLEGMDPGSLNRFVMNVIPQGKPDEVGNDAYEKELLEKKITPDQVTVFYHICYFIEGITPATAIAALSRIRQLENQHTQIINTFLKKGVVFGDKPISNDNILSLLNLWVSLPKLNERKQFKKFFKKLSRQPDKNKKDFYYIIQSFKEELKKEKERSTKDVFSSIRNFFG